MTTAAMPPRRAPAAMATAWPSLRPAGSASRIGYTPSINDVNYEQGTPVHRPNPAALLRSRKAPGLTIEAAIPDRSGCRCPASCQCHRSRTRARPERPARYADQTWHCSGCSRAAGGLWCAVPGAARQQRAGTPSTPMNIRLVHHRADRAQLDVAHVVVAGSSAPATVVRARPRFTASCE